jgi:hypothetical protein
MSRYRHEEVAERFGRKRKGRVRGRKEGRYEAWGVGRERDGRGAVMEKSGWGRGGQSEGID